MQDHYATLGLTKTASTDEIKAAFKQLAKKHHPDVGGDPNKFKDINEAYSILSDAAKRAEYDAPRNRYTSHRGATWDMDDFIHSDDFFSIFTGAAGFPNRRAAPRNGNIRTTLKVSLRSTLQEQKYALNINHGQQPIQLEVTVPKGVRSGAIISYKGMGQTSLPGPPGDLLIEIKVEQDADFERDGDDLHSTITIKAWDAMLGTHVKFRTIRDKEVRINIPAGMQHGTVMRLTGEGMPTTQGGQVGHQYVRVAVLIPNNLTEKQIELLHQIRSLAQP